LARLWRRCGFGSILFLRSNVRTGKLVWSFHTIPRPGEFGYDTGPKDAWKRVGGANVWGEFSVDEKRGIVYAPTASAKYNFYGVNREGANLFADCLLALDARTGKRCGTSKWSITTFGITTMPLLRNF
jgi:glucose dehydrogenase